MAERDSLLPQSSKSSSTGAGVSGGQWRSLRPEPQYGSVPAPRRGFLPKFDFQRRHAWIVAIALTLGIVAIGVGLGVGLSKDGPAAANTDYPGTSTVRGVTTHTTTKRAASTASTNTVTVTRSPTVIPINSSTLPPPPGRNATTIVHNGTSTQSPVLNAVLRGTSLNRKPADANNSRASKVKQPARKPHQHAVVRFRGEEEATILQSASRRSGRFKRAAVASDGKPCAQIAKDVLVKGGSAIDGAIAGLLCDGIVNAQSVGIGGGFVMTIYNESSKTAETLIARETAPLAAQPDMFANDSQASVKGGLAVAIPGEIRGYWDAHQRYGKLPWKDLFLGAISLCENGSAVQSPLALALQKERSNIIAEKSLSDIFVDPKTGDVLKEGDIMYRKKLGETLRHIAENGPDSFYTGDIASKLLADLAEFNAIITTEDLANYTAEWRPSFVTRIKGTGLKMYTTPPPTSGPVLGFILKVMAGYYNESATQDSPNFRNWTSSDQGLFLHRLTEAFKHGYGRRASLGDPRFLSNDIQFRQTLTSFRDDRFAKFIRTKINDSATTDDLSYYGAKFYVPADAGTAHLSIVDEDGLAVAVTSTINTQFGARIRSRRTGIIFNNEMDDFGSPNSTNAWGQAPSPTNFPEPGESKIVIGGAGGTKITTAVAYVLNLVLGGSENLADAADFPRLHHQLFPPVVQHEATLPQDLLDELVSRGHKTEPYASNPGSVVVSIGKEDDGWFAVSDKRKAGDVDGY